ncbi:MAG: hypothetical protein JSS64_05155 [Bacteroidetes bacterium]|nr:hypothetical protein [Bacteroidota bacterium]
MFHNCVKLAVVNFLLLSPIVSSAQNTASNRENSPYSRYGLGELRNGSNTALKSMANQTAAYANGYLVNPENPASYASLKLVTYELGAEGRSRTLISNNQSATTGTATLSHLTIGIPVAKHAGIAFGLRPYTRVYYRMNDSLNLDGMGPALKVYSGDGGTNYAFLGGGWQYKGFSIGVNVGYLFGTIRNSVILQKQYDTVNAYNSDFSVFRKIGGLHYEVGTQYYTSLRNKLGLRLGANASFAQNLNLWADTSASLWRNSGTSTIFDTATYVNNARGTIRLPLSYSIGAQLFNENKWMAGINFSAAKWSEFRNAGSVDSVTNSFKISMGGEYTPDATSYYQYLRRITYRLGFYYGKDFVDLRNTSINYYAVTAGASLPFKRSQDRIHMGLELGRRGKETNGLVRENFFRFYFGISLNDRWFVKRKYD